MTKYRIRIYNTQGLELMNRSFDDSAAWDKYWDDLQKKESLMGFSGQGLLVFAKEAMSPMGQWEPYDKFPVTIAETI